MTSLSLFAVLDVLPPARAVYVGNTALKVFHESRDTNLGIFIACFDR